MHNFRSKRFFKFLGVVIPEFDQSNVFLLRWSNGHLFFLHKLSLIMITPKIYYLQYKEKPPFKSLRKLNERTFLRFSTIRRNHCIILIVDYAYAGNVTEVDQGLLISPCWRLELRDGPLEKLWGGGEFSSCRNFFSLSNSLHEFFQALVWIFLSVNWCARIFFKLNFPLREFYFCTSPAAPPPP